MKEKIYTIPVTDALKEAEICPFCYMKEKLEKETVEYTIGPSYMEDDIRAKSDELGFCSRHYSVIMAEQNKLGVALMSHTYIQKLIKDIELLKDDNNKTKKSLFKKISNPIISQNQLVTYAKKTSNTCYMCDRIDHTLYRYIDCFIYVYNNDDNIKSLFSQSKGVCYTHFSQVLNIAEQKMKDIQFNEFKDEIVKKELENLKKLEIDLDFFIKKFDYKNNNLPWGDKRDVLDRVSNYLK